MKAGAESPVAKSNQDVPAALPKEPSRTLARTKRILVPTGFSEPANRALDYALRLVQQENGELTLLHVVELVIAPEFAAYTALTDEEDLKRRMRERLCTMVSDAHAQEALKEVIVRRGTPYHEICKVADEMHADIIVIGTHGYTGMKHMLLGSTAERVVRYAPCPVLVVPSNLHKTD